MSVKHQQGKEKAPHFFHVRIDSDIAATDTKFEMKVADPEQDGKTKTLEFFVPAGSPLQPFSQAAAEAWKTAEGMGAKELIRVRTRRTRVISRPTFPLSEAPKTIGWRLRRTFTFVRMV